MSYLSEIFVTGIVVIGIYRLFELFARKKERMAIIERLGEQIKLSDANVDLSLPYFNQFKGNLALKISLLLVGIGLGLIVAYSIEFSTFGEKWIELTSDKQFYIGKKMEVVYYSSVFLFGGIGLLIAYLIERKHLPKK